MELHLKDSLHSGPVTKFSGLNVIKMLGDDYWLFFGENPKKVMLTFLLINVPATLLNSLVATVSIANFFKTFLGFWSLEGSLEICPSFCWNFTVIGR